MSLSCQPPTGLPNSLSAGAPRRAAHLPLRVRDLSALSEEARDAVRAALTGLLAYLDRVDRPPEA
jgi:hypothetical protein